MFARQTLCLQANSSANSSARATRILVSPPLIRIPVCIGSNQVKQDDSARFTVLPRPVFIFITTLSLTPFAKEPHTTDIPGISQGIAGRGSSLFHQPLKHSAPPESPSMQLSASCTPDEKEKPWCTKFPQARGSSATGSVRAGCLAPSGWQVPPLPSSPHTSLPSAFSVAPFPTSQRKVGQSEGSPLPQTQLRPPASVLGSNSLPPSGSNLAPNSLAVSYSPPRLTHGS